MQIEAELAGARPRKIKYVPKENPINIDPVWLCLAAIAAIFVAGMADFMAALDDQKPAMLAVFPLFIAPFAIKLVSLLRQRKLVCTGEAVSALLNMVPRKLWWPKDFLGYSGIIYDVQAKYEYGGKKYLVDCLSKDPTAWRGRFVTVILDPKKPSRSVIYQICSYQVQ